MLAEPTEAEGGADDPKGRPSLDKATKHPELPATGSVVAESPKEVHFPLPPLPALPSDLGKVLMSVYPNCGEVTMVPAVGRLHRKAAELGSGKRVPPQPNPARCQAEAVRRARTTVRRFCAEHKLVYMWTLTYRGDGEHDVEQVRRHVERLREKIVKDRNGRPFPYVAVPELHSSDHGFHVHMAVPFWYKHRKLAKAWGRGHVWCSSLHQRGQCRFEGSRRAAGYLAKYIGKAFEETAMGRHRYWRASGYTIERFTCRQRDFFDGEQFAAAVFHWQRHETWKGRIDDWLPIRVLRFDGRVPNDD